MQTALKIKPIGFQQKNYRVNQISISDFLAFKFWKIGENSQQKAFLLNFQKNGKCVKEHCPVCIVHNLKYTFSGQFRC